MTYQTANSTIVASTKVLFTKSNHSGSLSVNDYANLDTSPIFSNLIGSTINSNSIVLSGGNYLIECCLAIDNSNNPITNYVNFNIEIDGTLGNSPGSSIQDNKVGIDMAVATLDVAPTATSTVKFKITSVGGICEIADDYSFIRILQV
tara:strand:+ start:44 stop:487 length:444 start_codon:yes stop_codon:yes gene_type:complete